MPSFGAVARAFVVLLGLCGAQAAPVAARAEDSYLLAMSWQPAFCAAGDHAPLPECKLAKGAAPRLVLHGLWPDWDVNADGKRNAGDDFCIAGESDRNSVIGLDGGDWRKLPEVKLSAATGRDLDAVMPGVASGLERHEWWKHGTCSGLAAEDYFALATVLALQVERSAIGRLIAGKAGQAVDRKALLDAFEREFGAKSARALTLDCAKAAGGGALQEIRIRLQRAKLAEGLNAAALAKPAKPVRGDCPAKIQIPG
jgi:ribonuclease T2